MKEPRPSLRKLGRTEINVSPVALGCWPIAGMTSLDVNDSDSLATILAALDAGINFVDTAYCYGPDGESEKLIGRAIENRRREDIVIASKGGIHWDKNLNRHQDASIDRIVQECNESLLRLNTGYLDLHYLHSPDPNVPVGESAQGFLKLLDAGKVRAVGASNLDLKQLEEFQSVCPLAAVQPPFNMLQRQVERDLIPWCRDRNISVINYWPLMKGLLAGKIRRGHVFDPLDKRLTYDVFQGEAFERAQNLLDLLDEVAQEHDKSVAQIVVNWTMNRPGITSTLCGAKRSWQIEETAGAMGWDLDSETLKRIDQKLSDLSV